MNKTFVIIAVLMLCGLADATPLKPLEGSYIRVNVVDAESGVRISNYTIIVSVEYPGDLKQESYTYNRTYAGENRIGFSMPPRSYGAGAKISVTSEGYNTSVTEPMTSDYYWNNLGGEYIKEYTFKVKREEKPLCCIPAVGLILPLMAAVTARQFLG
ncbi:MAG: hypothetical protein ABIH11_07305 [Candidatus Altiarchaeota archaeon]